MALNVPFNVLVVAVWLKNLSVWWFATSLSGAWTIVPSLIYVTLYANTLFDRRDRPQYAHRTRVIITVS
jgi:hypothetical protein